MLLASLFYCLAYVSTVKILVSKLSIYISEINVVIIAVKDVGSA
jgi:hypothetical protein